MNWTAQLSVTAAFIIAAAAVQAQDTWSLERCINYALENNLTVKQAKASVKTAQLTQQQAKSARLPNVSANINGGQQFGRTIDPTTNSFVSTGIGSNSLNLNASIPIFQGGQIHYNIKQATLDAQAAQADAAQTANNLGLQVAQAYLTILLNEEQAKNAVRRIEQSRRQLDATKKLIDAGTVPPADQFNIIAQIAREEQSSVVAQNSVDLAYLNLKQLLQVEPDYPLQIERPAFVIPADAAPESLTLTPLYSTALGTQPNIKASELRILSAEQGIQLARAAYYPTMSIGFNINSFYSTAARDFSKATLVNTTYSAPQTILVNGQELSVRFPNEEYDAPKIPYFSQVDRNFGQSIGFNISVPIYQNGRTRLGVERARLNVLNAQLQNTQAKQTLKNDIQTAIANARSARKQLEAAERTFDANKTAYANMEKRHALGAVNTLELSTAKNNLDISENDLVVAKYDYLFRLKIVDFYEGKTISLR